MGISNGDKTLFWLDLTNEYCSTPHLFISVTLQNYRLDTKVFSNNRLRCTIRSTQDVRTLRKRIVTWSIILSPREWSSFSKSLERKHENKYSHWDTSYRKQGLNWWAYNLYWNSYSSTLECTRLYHVLARKSSPSSPAYWW